MKPKIPAGLKDLATQAKKSAQQIQTTKGRQLLFQRVCDEGNRQRHVQIPAILRELRERNIGLLSKPAQAIMIGIGIAIAVCMVEESNGACDASKVVPEGSDHKDDLKLNSRLTKKLGGLTQGTDIEIDLNRNIVSAIDQNFQQKTPQQKKRTLLVLAEVLKITKQQSLEIPKGALQPAELARLKKQLPGTFTITTIDPPADKTTKRLGQ